MRFETVNKTVKSEHVSENLLRGMIRQGTCPGYYSGNRFYVNVDKLLEMLNQSTARRNCEADRA